MRDQGLASCERQTKNISTPGIVPVIMAGGKSSRMGRDKAFLPWGCVNLLERLLREFSKFGEIYVTAAKDGGIGEYLESIGYEVKQGFSDREEFFIEGSGNLINPEYIPAWGNLSYMKTLPERIVVLYDSLQSRGPIEGLRRAAESISGWFMAIAVDMPFVACEFADYLRQFACECADAVVPLFEDKIHPLCALYRAEGIRDIAKDNAERGIGKIRLLLEGVRTRFADLSLSKFAGNVLLNANSPDDLENIKGPSPAFFSVSGFKNSGKTTLAAKLINKFSDAGFSVGAVKHDGHDYEMDRDGTDTQKFSEAGALVSGIYSANKWSMNSSAAAASMDDMLRAAAAGHKAASENADDSLDIIVAEGDKRGSLPKVALVSDEEKFASVGETFGPNIICIAAPHAGTSVQINGTSAEIYQRDDVDGIFAAVMRAIVAIYPWLAARKFCRQYLPDRAGLRVHETD